MRTNSHHSNYSQPPADFMTLGFTGVAGFNNWPGYQLDLDYDYNHFWKPLIRVQDHLNGTDVINTLSEGGGSWGHGMGEAKFKIDDKSVKPIEHQYYYSQDKNNVVGYIKNRTFNVTSRHDSCDTCLCITAVASPFDTAYTLLWDNPQPNQRLKVKDLNAGHQYQIDYYTTFHYAGDGYLGSECRKAVGGKITLEYDPLYVFNSDFILDRPVIWYVMHEGCSSSLMVNDETNVVISDESTFLDINALSKDAHTRLYPNPFKDSFIVESEQEDNLILQTPEGQIIGEYVLTKGKNEIKPERLASGIYFAFFKNQRLTFKLLKL